jgi:hypothetical protein
MGNDGGSIPGRQDLVKVHKKKKKTISDSLIKSSKSKFCSLSKDPLKKPIVGDKLGQLYNKKNIIECLLNKSFPKIFNHITSLKDVKELNCNLSKDGKIECGISLEEFSGMNKFYFLWSCGCVISKNAIDKLGMKDKCLICNCPFKNKDLISLNYTNEEKEKIRFEIIKDKKFKNKNKENKENGNLGKKRIRD